MPVTDSPLRYPGGKTQLATLVSDLLRGNNLQGGIYAEPFAGGAGLALKLLYSGHVSEIWLNDIDYGIYCLWKVILDEPGDLCELIARARLNMTEWKRQRSILSSNRQAQLTLAFATLYLNRTNRSGIIGGGVIGGKDQRGTYKLGCRFNKKELIAKIQRIAQYRDVIKVSRADARLCMPLWSKKLPKRSLMNIDPPYYVRGQELYLNFYEPKDHAELAKIIRRLSCNWILTYDDAKQVQELYAGLPVFRKGLTYYAQVKRKANELLVISPKLAIPGGLDGDLEAA